MATYIKPMIARNNSSQGLPFGVVLLSCIYSLIFYIKERGFL